MRLRYYLLPVLIFICCSCQVAKAGSMLGFGSAAFSRDTLHIGDTLFINSYVRNFDTLAYNDIISFGLKINGIQNVNQVLFPNPYYDQIVTINPGDSIIAKMQIIITASYFDIGPDILVVWPIAHDGSSPILSIDSQIVVIDRGVGFIDTKNIPDLKAYYSDKNIFLKSTDMGVTLNRVSIFDMDGREILNLFTDINHPIPFSWEPEGVYFVEVNFNEGVKRIYKIVKH